MQKSLEISFSPELHCNSECEGKIVAGFVEGFVHASPFINVAIKTACISDLKHLSMLLKGQPAMSLLKSPQGEQSFLILPPTAT